MLTTAICTLLLDHKTRDDLDFGQPGKLLVSPCNPCTPGLLNRCRSTLQQTQMELPHRHMNLCTWYPQANQRSLDHWEVWRPISTVRNWSSLAGITATSQDILPSQLTLGGTLEPGNAAIVSEGLA